jgi:BirA family biotin operon repressor/biotin-[acetyl-CoA-carboxylase] ligase
VSLNLPGSFSVRLLESVPSTNDLVLERIRTGRAMAGEVFAARIQSRARGRMGRHWAAAEGGLWFTAAMPLYGPSVGWGGLLAALAVCRALDAEGLRAGVKWPNDVVISGKKLAGILVEAVTSAGLAAVGVGLNVRNALPDAPDANQASAGAPERAPHVWPPTSVAREMGRAVDPQALLPPILAHLGELWQTWEAGRLVEMQSAWSERDACRGRRVQLLPAGPGGIADGIDQTGALRVRLPDGRIELALAGELAFVAEE